VPPKADSNKMAAAQPNAVFDVFVKFPPIGGEGDGRMVKTTGAVRGPILDELENTMPAVMQGIPPDKTQESYQANIQRIVYVYAGFRPGSALFGSL
jgi:hypothetical protein